MGSININELHSLKLFFEDLAKVLKNKYEIPVESITKSFNSVMNEYVSCVRLLGVTPFGPNTYLVNLAAQYVKPFPAGSGALPAFWTVDDGVIIEAGTGPPG